MPNPKTWLLAGAALALATAGLTATTALAQTSESARREAAADTAATARTERAERSEQGERREVRIYRADRSGQLSDILQLRPDQEPALKAFLDVTRKDDDRRDRMVTFQRDADRTTLERLDEMQARMADQQADASRRIAAIKAFYGQLDAKQKKAFDALPMLMMVGPSMGPMVIPHRIAFTGDMPLPPEPPAPPRPPRPPRS